MFDFVFKLIRNEIVRIKPHSLQINFQVRNRHILIITRSR